MTSPDDPLRRRLRAALLSRLADRMGDVPSAQLKRLVAALDRAADDEHARSALVEAAIAERLLASDCDIELEVPTNTGRTADFHVHRAGESFHLHVKRWTPARDDEPITLVVPRRVRELEKVRRPFLVGVHWPSSPRALGRFVAETQAFLGQASVGDELVFHADDGSIAGGARVLAAWPGDRVVVTVGLDAALGDEARRLQRLLRKACGQFMPRSANVILICGGVGGGNDAEENRHARAFDQALQGSHVERWDLFPPRGQTVAHGRGDDGFWSGGRFPQSRVVAWCPWQPSTGLGTARLWRRSDATHDVALEASVRAAIGA